MLHACSCVGDARGPASVLADMPRARSPLVRRSTDRARSAELARPRSGLVASAICSICCSRPKPEATIGRERGNRQRSQRRASTGALSHAETICACAPQGTTHLGGVSVCGSER
eukprot:1519686-Prymnesium_polylepis.2